MQVIYAMWFGSISGGTHQEQLESFYAKQARLYDSYRCRMLHGRKPMVDNMPATEGAVWVDLGGGTGANLEFFGPGINSFKQVVVVDLTPSLVQVRSNPFTLGEPVSVLERNFNIIAKSHPLKCRSSRYVWTRACAAISFPQLYHTVVWRTC